MENKQYLKHELNTALKEHDDTYNISVKFSGSKHSSRNLDLTKEQFNQIYEVLTK